MRAGQAGPALGVKAGLVAPVTVRVYFTRPGAGTDRTNARSWSNQKPLHRGSRTCRPSAPNQRRFKEDRGFIDWLDFMEIISSHQSPDPGRAIFRRYVHKLGILPSVGSAACGKREALVDSLCPLSKSF